MTDMQGCMSSKYLFRDYSEVEEKRVKGKQVSCDCLQNHPGAN